MKYLSRTAWLLIAPSAAILSLGIALLTPSLTSQRWIFSQFEAMAGAVIALSLAGIACGVGLLFRYKPARLPAIGLLSAAALFWAIPVVQFMLFVFSEPEKAATDIREAPFLAAGVALVPVAIVLWCVHTIYMLRKPHVRAEFDA